MRKRQWVVEWRARGKSDGLHRLGQMVQLVIDRAVAGVTSEQRSDVDAADRVDRAEEMMR
jgi:hypothetical protein